MIILGRSDRTSDLWSSCVVAFLKVFFMMERPHCGILVYNTNGGAGEAHIVHFSSDFDGHFFARSFGLFRGTSWWHDGLKGGFLLFKTKKILAYPDTSDPT